MKVCIIVNEYPPDRVAGTAMATRALALSLIKKGINVSVIVTERRKDAAPSSSDEGIRLIRLSSYRLRVMRWLRRILEIRMIVREICPDIIHGQSISCGFYGIIAGWRRNIPTIVSIQGQDYYQSTRIQKWTEIRWTLRGADKITAVTRTLANETATAIKVRSIKVLPHGFTVNKSYDNDNGSDVRRKLGVKCSEFILICVARLEWIKGVDILLDAMQYMKETKLWIVGDGSERESLKAQCAEYQISEDVLFMGNLSNSQVHRFLKSSDMFVLPSRMEAFGISLLEAMNAGLPIVAAKVGGIPEIISRENGILVPPEDPLALSTAINALKLDKKKREEMSEKNKRKAFRYKWDILVDNYVEAYESTIDARTSKFGM